MPAAAPLLRTPRLTATDFRCRARRGDRSREEAVDLPELVLVRRGLFVVAGPRGDAVVDANHAVLLEPGCGYRFWHPLDGGDRCTAIAVEPELLREVLGDRPAPRRSVATSGAAHLLHGRLLAALAAGVPASAAEESVFHLLAAAIGAPAAGRAPDAVQCETVEHAKLALGGRLDRRLVLDEIAREVHVSPFHLSRLFHRATGATLSRYHRSLRLRRGLERIIDGERDLARLALELGFAHHSHFTNAFRREFGVAPSACRGAAGARELLALRRRLPP